MLFKAEREKCNCPYCQSWRANIGQYDYEPVRQDESDSLWRSLWSDVRWFDVLYVVFLLVALVAVIYLGWLGMVA